MLAQGVLSWVGQAAPGREPPRFEARLYDKLFQTSCVADTGDDWLEDLNPHSLTAVEGALATPRLTAAAAGDKCVPRSPQPGSVRLFSMLLTACAGRSLCPLMLSAAAQRHYCTVLVDPVR